MERIKISRWKGRRKSSGEEFLNRPHRAQTLTLKILNGILSKLKIMSKDTIIKVENQPIDWEKILSDNLTSGYIKNIMVW